MGSFLLNTEILLCDAKALLKIMRTLLFRTEHCSVILGALLNIMRTFGIKRNCPGIH